MDSDDWARYYEVTVDRPAWGTVRSAIERFAVEDTGASRERFAVDLGCGAGRDARALLQAGWTVLAVDREAAAIASLEAATPPEQRAALQTQVADLATFEVPACDLVNANLVLPFLAPDAYWATWHRILVALPVGGRLSAMLFGDRDQDAGDPTMTHPAPNVVLATLGDFDVEHWVDNEDDGVTALGEPHHFHMLELVARRLR